MNMMRMKQVGAACALALFASVAGAQVYAGVGGGVTSFEQDCTGAETCDNTSMGGKFYGGFAVNPNLAFEVGYLDFGKAKSTGWISVYGNPVFLHVDLQATAVTAAVALRGPISHELALVGRLGVAQVKMTGKVYTNTVSVPDETQTTTKPYAALGLEYGFSQKLRGVLSADFTQGEIVDEPGSLRMVSVGLQYAF